MMKTDGLLNPFDAIAARYDREFDEAPVASRLREVVQDSLFRHFLPGSRVLELNCGTGTDAISLARRGVRVTAIDSSPGMVARARAKIVERDLSRLITCVELDTEDLDSLDGGLYDGAYSNFAGLNCSPDLRRVAGKVAGLLRPGSVFVACLLNRVCVWEIASFLARGRVLKAFRRMRKGGVDVPVGSSFQHIWYYSPAGVRRILSPWFEVKSIYGLSIVSPPPHASRFASAYPELTRQLTRWDARIRSIPPFRGLGDHVVVVGVRTSA